MSEKIENALISEFKLTSEDGYLNLSLTLEYECGCQNFGGYALYLPKSFKNHEIGSVAGHHIFRCMEIAGVTDLSKIVGKSIRAVIRGGIIREIGHIVKNDFYSPARDFESYRNQIITKTYQNKITIDK